MTAPSELPGVRRVLLLNGVISLADAISRSLLLKRAALIDAFGGDIAVDIVAGSVDAAIPGARGVGGLLELLGLACFRQADVIIYEFGIWYELFGSVRFRPPGGHAIGVWHNVTPPALAADAAGRALLRRSLRQTSNLLHCDHVFADSAYNAGELPDVEPSRLSVLPLPVASLFLTHGEDTSPPRMRLKLLFVGRFVPSKGVLDLVRAFAIAAAAEPCDTQLTLVGNPEFSAPATLAAIQALASERLLFRGMLDDAALATAYRDADIVIVPSYHEGFCLPVIEAFAAGCHVIATDAGNLPSIVGDHGEIVPVGDVAALAAALADCLAEHRDAWRDGRARAFRTRRGRVPEPRRRIAVRRYAAGFSERNYAAAFLTGLSEIVARPRLAAPS